jgi:hypothetical protein
MSGPVAWTIEMAFGDQIFDTTPTWTDVTAYVRAGDSMSLRRGRRGQFSEVQPGTGSFTLDNRDGRFTPGLSTGAYYPNIKRSVPVRVRATANSTTYDVFRGWATKWTPMFPGSVDTGSVVSFEMSDLLGVLDKNTLLTRVAHTALTLGATVLWPLWEGGDGEDASLFGSLTQSTYWALTRRSVGWGGKVTPLAVSGPDGEAGAALFEPASSTDGAYLQAIARGVTIADAYEGTLFFWLNSDGDPDAAEGADFPACEVAAFAGSLFTTSDSVFFRIDTAGGLSAVIEGGTPTLYGGTVTHHSGVKALSTELSGWTSVALVMTGDITNKTFNLYVNGVLRDTWTGALTMAFPKYGVRFGGNATDGMYHGALAYVGKAPAWSAADVAEFHAAGYNGFRGERPEDRIVRLCEWAGVPSAFASTSTIADVGVSRMGRAEVAGKTVHALLQEVATTDAGVVWAGRDGTVKFHSRFRRRVPSTYTYSLAMDYIVSPNPTLDDSSLSERGNAVSCSHADTGSTFVHRNTASIAQYGEYGASVSVNSLSYHEARARAQWQAGKTDSESLRWDNLVIDLSAVPAAVAAGVLSLDIGDVLRVSGIPSVISTSSTVDLWVEGITHSVNKGRHAVSIATSPTATESRWILGDATAGKLTSTTPVLAY